MTLHWKRTLEDDWHRLYKDRDILSRTEALAREMIATYSASRQLRGLYGELGHYNLDQLSTPSQIITKLKRSFAHDFHTWLRLVGEDGKTTGEHILAFFEQDMEAIAQEIMARNGPDDPMSGEGIELRTYVYIFGWKSLLVYVLGIMTLEYKVSLWNN